MTAKRNFKRRVRERQVQTGERYTVARRRLLAERSGGPSPAVPVVELHEVSAEAARLGFRCRIFLFPSVIERAELALVLAGLREALVGATGDPDTVQMFDAAFGVTSTNRQRLGLPGVAFEVAGRADRVPVMCRMWGREPSGRYLVLTLRGEAVVDLPERAVSAPITQRPPILDLTANPPNTREGGEPQARALRAGDPVRVTGGPFATFSAIVEEVKADRRTVKVSLSVLERATSVELDLDHVEKSSPALFVIYAERYHQITTALFVIGSNRSTSDLALHDRNASHKHAAVIHRDGAYYLKALGSAHGIHYKGMRIDNKRIDEGDVFQIGDHELRFTYRADG